MPSPLTRPPVCRLCLLKRKTWSLDSAAYLIYKADGTKQANWNNPAETILGLKAAAAMYQAFVAVRLP